MIAVYRLNDETLRLYLFKSSCLLGMVAHRYFRRSSIFNQGLARHVNQVKHSSPLLQIFSQHLRKRG